MIDLLAAAFLAMPRPGCDPVAMEAAASVDYSAQTAAARSVSEVLGRKVYITRDKRKAFIKTGTRDLPGGYIGMSNFGGRWIAFDPVVRSLPWGRQKALVMHELVHSFGVLDHARGNGHIMSARIPEHRTDWSGTDLRLIAKVTAECGGRR